MRKPLGFVWAFILVWLFFTVLLVFFIQARSFYGANPIVRESLDKKEAFQNPPKDSEETTHAGDPVLSNMRQPFNLLNDWLAQSDKPAYPTAKTCRDVDFQVRLERTGNFRQLTNNYKRGDPDSCSTPLQDFTLAFYKTEPIPDYGCVQPYVE
jgi:hypothetical protein